LSPVYRTGKQAYNFFSANVVLRSTFYKISTLVNITYSCRSYYCTI